MVATKIDFKAQNVIGAHIRRTPVLIFVEEDIQSSAVTACDLSDK